MHFQKEIPKSSSIRHKSRSTNTFPLKTPFIILEVAVPSSNKESLFRKAAATKHSLDVHKSDPAAKTTACQIRSFTKVTMANNSLVNCNVCPAPGMD